jgi:hypothetical protein
MIKNKFCVHEVVASGCNIGRTSLQPGASGGDFLCDIISPGA